MLLHPAQTALAEVKYWSTLPCSLARKGSCRKKQHKQPNFTTYHNVVGVHGFHGIQELELHLLVLTVVLEREVLHPPPGLYQLHGNTWRARGTPGYCCCSQSANSSAVFWEAALKASPVLL